MIEQEEIELVSFYMRDASYESFCGGGKPYPKFIPLPYKFQDFDKMSDQIPGSIMRLR